jgi:hypothetical protein
MAVSLRDRLSARARQDRAGDHLANQSMSWKSFGSIMIAGLPADVSW